MGCGMWKMEREVERAERRMEFGKADRLRIRSFYLVLL